MIPDAALQMLLHRLVDAMPRAARGRPAEGYDCLLAGLHDAEALAEQGIPWGAALSHRYRQALQAFEERYGVPLS
jgi:hypothetical protein